MQTIESSENVITSLPELTVTKLRLLQEKLGTADLDSALDKSLNIANYVADTMSDPENKLLVERDGRYIWLKEIA